MPAFSDEHTPDDDDRGHLLDCPSCDGEGFIADAGAWVRCPDCEGLGRLDPADETDLCNGNEGRAFTVTEDWQPDDENDLGGEA